MGSFRRPHAFDPLDLEIIDQVYEATWAQIEARYFRRDTSRDDERQKALRRWLFALAASPVDFDTLYDKVVTSLPKWAAQTPKVDSQVSEMGEAKASSLG
jgi:hypothetical protein